MSRRPYTRTKICCTCRKRRPLTTFYGSDHGHPRCRVCMKLRYLRYQPNPEVEAIVRAYGDLDEQLAAALGPRWPHRLARAARGAYAR